MRLKIVINCGPCEDYIGQCLRSVRAQTFRQWEAFVTVDACGDDTAERAFEARAGDDRIDITVNSERLYSMANLIGAIQRSNSAPDNVIVILDGDDWFATEGALERIVAEYERHDCWMTYGSWIADDPACVGLRAGRWPPYPEGTTNFREAVWLGTAVRSWKKWLWDKIEDSAFRRPDGNYILVAEDMACMLPMFEMSGTDRARHIPDVLMVYNRTTPHGVGKIHLDLMLETAAYLRGQPPYRRL